MDKQSLLDLISRQIAAGTVSASEIQAVLQAQTGNATDLSASSGHRITATSILYGIGALVLIAGIGSFVFRFWDDLNGAVRIAITLGLAAAAYIAGALLRGDADHGKISRILFFVSGILAPIGMFVSLDTAGIDYATFGWSTTICLLLTAIYGASLFIFRGVEFAFFTLVFATCTIYAAVGYFLDISGSANLFEDTYEYVTIALGTAYLLIQSTLSGRRGTETVEARDERAFDRFLTFFGAAGILGALIALSGWSPEQSFLWEFVSVLAVLGGLYLASRSGNRTLLKTSALFVFILIIRFTSEYFVDSLGWPIALIFAGIALLAAGYGLVALGKRK
ncbi:MAG: DUF2157 domain-containing protein [Patescibacteria group bacterium]